MSITQDAKRFAQLDKEEKDLNAQLELIKSEKSEIEARLLEEMSDEGIPKVTVELPNGNGGPPDKRTVFSRREIWAGHQGDRDALINALKMSGMEDMVKENFNTQSLSAWVREYATADDGTNLSPEEIISKLPEQLKEHIKVSEKYMVRTTKS